MSGYPELKFKPAEYDMPLPLEGFDLPVTFDDFSKELLRVSKEIDTASSRHLHYSLLKAKYVGQYKTDWNRAYARHAGLDLSKPVHEQRPKRSRATINELEAGAAEDMGERFHQMEMVDCLIKAWLERVDSLKSQLMALQSCAANLRTEEQLSRMMAPKY